MKNNMEENKNIGQILQAKTSGKKIRNKRNQDGQNRKEKSGRRAGTLPGTVGKKRKKWLRIVMILILVLMVLSIVFVLLIDAYVEKTGKRDVLAMDQLGSGYDCVIVPGAAVYQNSIPSPMLKDRLDVAAEIYRKKIVPKILVSGDNGNKEYDEVTVMQKYLIDNGIPAKDIVMDYAGFDTYQTIYRARDVFQVKKAVIATQDFHLYRALYIGEKLSVDLVGVDSTLRDYNNSLWNRSREYLARVKAFLECEIFKPKPKFLGDVIPIGGDAKTE